MLHFYSLFSWTTLIQNIDFAAKENAGFGTTAALGKEHMWILCLIPTDIMI